MHYILSTHHTPPHHTTPHHTKPTVHKLVLLCACVKIPTTSSSAVLGDNRDQFCWENSFSSKLQRLVFEAFIIHHLIFKTLLKYNTEQRERDIGVSSFVDNQGLRSRNVVIILNSFLTRSLQRYHSFLYTTAIYRETDALLS